MDKEKIESIKVTTPEFRVSFPSVFEPSKMDGQPQDAARYSVTMLFDKNADLTQLKAAIRKAVEMKFPDPTKRPKGLKNPLRNGDEKPNLDGYPGCTFAAAKSKTRPGVVDQNVQPILSAEEFYAGCYARATVTVYYFDKAGNKGVALGLQNIQKIRDGQPFSGRSRAEDDFGSIDGEPSKAGATAVAAEDDPFA